MHVVHSTREEKVAENKFNPNDPRDLEFINRRFGGADPTHLPKPDPEFAYRYVREDPKAIKKANWKGWEVVKDSKEVERLGIRTVPGESNLDGCVRIQPDVILAKMPRRLYEEVERRKTAENRQRMARAEKYAEEKARELGLPFEGGNTPLGERKGK